MMGMTGMVQITSKPNHLDFKNRGQYLRPVTTQPYQFAIFQAKAISTPRDTISCETCGPNKYRENVAQRN